MGDIHAGDSATLSYAKKSIFAELRSIKGLDFIIFTGDLINDDTTISSTVLKEIKGLGIDYYIADGNHDKGSFVKSNQYFKKGKANFFILNNFVDAVAFLQSSLHSISQQELIAIVLHYPLKSLPDYKKILTLFEGYKNVLFLTGHTHRVTRSYHQYVGGVAQEVGVGAPCGTWWRGERDMFGIPFALMQCGSPRNYYIMDIEGSHYSMKYKAVGLDSAIQMNITESYLSGERVVTANLFSGGDSTVVEIKFGDGEWQLMNKVDDIDPTVSYYSNLYKARVLPTCEGTTLPLRRVKSPHLWRISTKEKGDAQVRFSLNYKID